MPYRGHLSVADTIFLNQVQAFYSSLSLYGGNLSVADTFLENQ